MFGYLSKNTLEGVRPQDFYVPGSLLKAVLDTDSPIAYGMPRETAVFFEQNAAFEVSGHIDRIGASSMAPLQSSSVPLQVSVRVGPGVHVFRTVMDAAAAITEIERDYAAASAHASAVAEEFFRADRVVARLLGVIGL